MPLVIPKEVAPEELDTMRIIIQSDHYKVVEYDKKRKGIFRETKYDGPFYVVTMSNPSFIIASASSEEKILTLQAVFDESLLQIEVVERSEIISALKQIASAADGGSSIGASVGNILNSAAATVLQLDHTFQPTGRDVITRALYMMDCSKKAYKMGDFAPGVTFTFDETSGKTIQIIHHSEIDDTVFYYVGFDVENPGDIVVGFRGTKNIKDALIDAFAALEKLDLTSYSFHSHKGIRMALKPSIPELVNVLNEQQEAGNIQSISFTGHSLGGAYAILAYTIIKGKSFKKTKKTAFNSKILLTTPMSVWTFGAPVIFGKQNSWNNELKSLNVDIHNFIHNYDIVPRLLGTKTLSNLIKSLLKVMPESMEKSRDLLNGFADSRVLTHMSEYKVFGNFYFLRSLREKPEGDEVFETKLKCSLATSEKDKKRIAAIPYAEMTKFGLTDAVKFCLADHSSKNYVKFLVRLLSQDS